MAFSEYVTNENTKSFKESVEAKIDEVILLNHELKEYSLEKLYVPAWFIRGVIQRGFRDIEIDGIKYNVVFIERFDKNKVKVVLEDDEYQFRFAALMIYNTAGVFHIDDYNEHGPLDKSLLLDSYEICFKKAYGIITFKVIDMTEEEFNNWKTDKK